MWRPSESKSAPPASSGQAPSARRSVTEPTIATIGSSISIQGDISGEGDLRIEGRVQGGIELRKHSVTIGRSGHVEADVKAKRICVEGEIQGNLFGDEIVVRESGRVEGDATASRVTLENGCQFRGRINMDPTSKTDAAPKSAPKSSPTPGSRRAAPGAA